MSNAKEKKKKNSSVSPANQNNKSKNYIRFDWAIKRLLRNKADFGAVNGLLSCIFEKQISIINVLESEGNQESENAKFNRVDVLVEDENGEKIIIEIQNNYQVDYYHRMLFGVSKVVTDFLKKGDNYDKIKKIFAVSIVYFELGQGTDYVYWGGTEFIGKHTNEILQLSKAQKRRYGVEKVGDIFPKHCLLPIENFNKEIIILTKDGTEHSDAVSLPNCEISKNESLDEWVYYLKTTDIPDNFTAQGLDEIREKQRVEDLQEEERNAYYRHLEQVNYEEGVIEHNRLEAKIEEKLEIAKKLLNSKIPINIIVESTGLTKEEIEKL